MRSEEEVYKIINKEPIEYENLLKDIKTRADSNKNLDGKSECKLLMRYLKKQWQEIERLNNDIKELLKENSNKEKVIIAQDNIINELEKYLDEQVDYMTHHSIERMVAFDCCRHKLQELKGSNKENV